jgi:hypothetical protein
MPTAASSSNRVFVRLSPLPPRRLNSVTVLPGVVPTAGEVRVMTRSLSQVCVRFTVTFRSLMRRSSATVSVDARVLRSAIGCEMVPVV